MLGILVALLVPASLLGVAIVGGAVFATVQDSCTKTVTGFTGNAVQLSQFGVSNGDMELELRNSAPDEIRLTRISIKSSGEEVASKSINETLRLGESKVVPVNGFQESDSCSSYEVTLSFERGQLGENTVEGTIQGKFSVS